MNPDELPLLTLFNRLRDHGLLLGVEEYTAVLRAIQAGFGLEIARHWLNFAAPSGPNPRKKTVCFGASLTRCWPSHSYPAAMNHLYLKPPAPPPDTDDDTSPPAESALGPPPSISPPIPSSPPSTPPVEIDEPVQVVQAIRRSGRGDWPMERLRYSLLTDYFPVTRRQMKQNWRYLRRPVREGPPEELDVKATVEKAGREGMLLEPVLVPRRSNRAELVLLVDQDGSMVPFHTLTRQIVGDGSARRPPETGYWLITSMTILMSTYILMWLDCKPVLSLKSWATINERTAVLIVSDAGAARGNFDLERVERTQAFIAQLSQVVRYYVWLNPMPSHRWPETSASKIAHLMPMFELSRSGLEAAISALRGQYVYWEKMYPWMI
jgi:hypothetical protein